MKQSFISFVLTLLMSLVGLNSFAQFSGTGSGTESDPYQITNAVQLNEVRNHLDKAFILMNDIDMTTYLEDESPYLGWLPIGTETSRFKGSFDGNNKTISNLWIARGTTNYVGLFGYCNNCSIINLTLKDVNIKGQNNVGAICGQIAGKGFITNCNITGRVEGTNGVGGVIGFCKSQVDFVYSLISASIDVKGTKYVGGIIGSVSTGTNGVIASITSCFVQGNVSGEFSIGGILGNNTSCDTNISGCGFRGNVSGNNYVGGIAGGSNIMHDLNLNKCFSFVTITNTSTKKSDHFGGLCGRFKGVASDCFSRGSVSGTENTGGLFGYATNGSIEKCYFDGEVSGQGYKVGGLIGEGGQYCNLNSSNVSIATSVASSTSTPKRIIGYAEDESKISQCKAYNRMVVIANGSEVDASTIEDNKLNGTGVGATTLKQQNTYSSMGWDFTNVWAISEGEGYPYLICSEQYLPKDPKDVASLTISPIAAVTYNGLAQTPAVTVTDGATTLTDGTDYTTSYSNNINAGTAAVTITGIGNYTGTNTTTFTIQKASLTVTAKSYTISQGDPLPTFEADYSGFMNGETSSVLTTQPTFNCSVSSTSNPGEYDITVSGVTADNYSISYVKGKLTISASGEDPEVPVEDTDIAQLDNTIYVNQTEMHTGNETTLSIRMKNKVAIRGFQFDMYLPEGITPMKNNKGRILATLTSTRLEEDDEHTLTSSEQPDGAIRFLCGSQYEETFTGNDGEVFTLKVSVAEDMEDGDYPLLMKNIKLSENNISNYYEVELVKTTLSVSSYTPGDINADGKIDVSDYIGVANHILGHTPEGFVMRAGDVDDSGAIDVSDYLGIGNIIHTGSVYGSNRAMGARASVEPSDLTTMDNVVYVLSETAVPGEDMTLSLCMKNTAAIRGFQFDLYLPEGVTVKKNSKGRILAALNKARLEEDDEHTMTTSEQPDGAIRFLCGSQYEETFTGTDGEVATLQVTIGSDMEAGDYPVILKDMKLSENDIRNFYETEQVVTMLTIPYTTGISSVHRATSADERYYNLQGQRVEPVKKGLYIINGRKVVIK